MHIGALAQSHNSVDDNAWRPVNSALYLRSPWRTCVFMFCPEKVCPDMHAQARLARRGAQVVLIVRTTVCTSPDVVWHFQGFYSYSTMCEVLILRLVIALGPDAHRESWRFAKYGFVQDVTLYLVELALYNTGH